MVRAGAFGFGFGLACSPENVSWFLTERFYHLIASCACAVACVKTEKPGLPSRVARTWTEQRKARLMERTAVRACNKAQKVDEGNDVSNGRAARSEHVRSLCHGGQPVTVRGGQGVSFRQQDRHVAKHVPATTKTG